MPFFYLLFFYTYIYLGYLDFDLFLHTNLSDWYSIALSNRGITLLVFTLFVSLALLEAHKKFNELKHYLNTNLIIKEASSFTLGIMRALTNKTVYYLVNTVLVLGIVLVFFVAAKSSAEYKRTGLSDLYKIETKSNLKEYLCVAIVGKTSDSFLIFDGFESKSLVLNKTDILSIERVLNYNHHLMSFYGWKPDQEHIKKQFSKFDRAQCKV